MNRGFVLLAIDTDEDKVKYAHATAMSIKLSDPEASVCIVMEKDKNLGAVYRDVFDYQVELPFGNSAYKDGFHGMNIWQLLHVTPYEETIYIDYDTVFLNVDVELLWDQFAGYDMAIPSMARTYRNMPVNREHLFEFERTYNLPQLFNNLIYFKRDSQLALDWFKMADPIFQEWRDVYSTLFKEKKPSTFNKNIIANIVTHLMDVESQVSFSLNNLYDLDIRSQWLWNQDVPDTWTDTLNYWFPENKKLIIENSIIPAGIVHYRDEEFLTDSIINEYRAQINISSRRKAAS